MTCAKEFVQAYLKTTDGNIYYGDNSCDCPQKKCPRWPWDGYEKCKTICLQSGHAEAVAIFRAIVYGSNPGGGVLWVVGNKKPCETCRNLMDAFGVSLVGEP